MTTTNQYIGGFLIAEAAASIAFSHCNNSLWQLGRLLRMGIGYYIYTRPE